MTKRVEAIVLAFSRAHSREEWRRASRRAGLLSIGEQWEVVDAAIAAERRLGMAG